MTTHVRRVRPRRGTPFLELFFLKILSPESALCGRLSREPGLCYFENRVLPGETQTLDISARRLLRHIDPSVYTTCIRHRHTNALIGPYSLFSVRTWQVLCVPENQIYVCVLKKIIKYETNRNAHTYRTSSVVRYAYRYNIVCIIFYKCYDL